MINLVGNAHLSHRQPQESACSISPLSFPCFHLLLANSAMSPLKQDSLYMISPIGSITMRGSIWVFADDCTYRAKSHDGVEEVRLSHSFSIHGERPRNAYGDCPQLPPSAPTGTVPHSLARFGYSPQAPTGTSAHGDSPPRRPRRRGLSPAARPSARPPRNRAERPCARIMRGD